MIRSQLQHATGKIADGAVNCLYAAGLLSPVNLMLLSFTKAVHIYCDDNASNYIVFKTSYI